MSEPIKQPASNPTAEERVQSAQHEVLIYQGGGCHFLRVVDKQDAIRIAEDHAAAAVKDLEARIAELERERDEARAERDFQAERAQVNVDLRVKAEVRVAKLEPLAALGRAIVRGAPTWQRITFTACILGPVTIDADTWYAAVAADKAALGKEAQP